MKFLTEKTKAHLAISRPVYGGMQYAFRFENDLGASVVGHDFSYGGRNGLFELAVIEWIGDDFDLKYDTPITDDVIGRLTEEDVLELLGRIESLEYSEGT